MACMLDRLLPVSKGSRNLGLQCEIGSNPFEPFFFIPVNTCMSESSTKTNVLVPTEKPQKTPEVRNSQDEHKKLI